jgi:glycosyltransferase involved in cell wall biosynthesis
VNSEQSLLQNVPGAGGKTPTADDVVSPTLSVIVPVHNGAMYLSRCLESLRQSEYPHFEVIVVDDCSTDSSAEIAKRYGARCFRTPHILGPAGARNMGVAYALAGIFVFVDADVVLPSNALDLIAMDFAGDAQLAALFGSYDDAPACDCFLSQYKNLAHSYVHQNSSERALTFWAGCGAVRREPFVKFGGFNATRYPHPSIEDIELGYRLSLGGQTIKLNKQLRVKHLKRWTLRSLLKADILRRAVPWTRLILETRHLPRDLNLTSRARVSAGLVGLLSAAWVLLFSQAAHILPTITFFPHARLAELAAIAVVTMVLAALNWDVYAFFANKRGWWFAARVVPMHWFYYFYSGVVFITCGTLVMLRAFVGSLLPGLMELPGGFRQ